MKFAYIGRNDHGKGLPILISAFKNLTDIAVELHVFSDSIDGGASNIVWHGWTDREAIWSSKFSYVCLPMTAPETYCFALHEAVKFGKGLIVNGENESLLSQIVSGVHTYIGPAELEKVLTKLALDKGSAFQEVVLKRKKSIWTRV
jgi:hypothetical protein